MAVTSPPFPVDLGDDIAIEIPVDVPGGAPADLDGATAEFGYGLAVDQHENAGRPSATPQLGTSTYRGATFPTIIASLPSAETGALLPYTNYYWAARVTLAGARKVVARGSFTTAPVPL